MPERVVSPGALDVGSQSARWVLVFGGVTREGNRRARRGAARALEEGWSVVWFDGYGEVFEDGSDQRVPLEVDLPSDAVTVVDYSVVERSHWLNRMGETVPKALIRPPEHGERRMASSRRLHVIRYLRRAIVRFALVFQRAVLRRLSQVFRGVVGWKLVKSDVLGLTNLAGPPELIVYGDEFALTQAWHAVRLWPDIEAAMEVKR
jgi:hypothetical protein